LKPLITLRPKYGMHMKITRRNWKKESFKLLLTFYLEEFLYVKDVN